MSDISFERMYRMRGVDIRTLDSDDLDQGHVIHLKMIAGGDRIVAVRPDVHVGVSLDFSDPAHPELRGKTLKMTHKQALSAVKNFLTAPYVTTRRFINTPWYGYESFINQAERYCEIVKVTRSRCRIEYEMPNSGINGAWRPATLIGNTLYIGD